MKKTFTLILFLFSQISFAQNLVPNWSFEDTISCPTGAGQIDHSLGWDSYRNTPDYLNSCNSLFVPSNVWGFQYPRTGNAYAGEAVYHSLIPNGREFLGRQLSQPLDSGTKYFASFYVCRAAQQSWYLNVATNKIGMRLSTIAYSTSNPLAIDNYAQVYTDSIITDTLTWIKISGSFVADSGYNYLSIGNFFDDSLVSKISYDSGVYAYYYIEDVCISTDSLACNPTVDMPEQENDNLIEIFPNPSEGVIYIMSNSIYPFEIIIYSSLGQIVYRDFIKDQKRSIDITNYANGVYLALINKKEKYIKKKIIKF